MEEKNQARDFVIAEVLACVTFVLNTVCVVTGEMKHGPTSPVWLPDFGLIYWLKTILAVVGIVYLFRSKLTRPRYIFILTLTLLLYSVPVLNSFLAWPVIYFLSGAIMVDTSGLDSNYARDLIFNARIPTQIFWSLPMLLIANNLLFKIIRKINKVLK